MSEWTRHPEVTGAYWFQVDGCRPDIVWVYDGDVWDIFLGRVSSAKDDARHGMFYGPLELPPPMPKEGAE